MDRPLNPAATCVVTHDVGSVELADWGPLPEATAHAMPTAGQILWSGANGEELGIWRCAEGPSRWHFETNEAIVLVEGSMTITRDGEEAVSMAVGDCAVFPKGWFGTWVIHESILKLYTVF